MIFDKHAKRGSGGVGFLVKETLLDFYDCSVLNNEYEGILWIKLSNKSATYIYCVCYLPPVGSSRYGTDPSAFFSILHQHVYTYQNDGVFCIFGDFNARSDDSDFIEGVDRVSARSVIDLTCNVHGQEMIDFLVDCNMCMLNGRIGKNDFTYVSTRGKSVIDYVFVPHEQLPLYTDFSVVCMSDLICERHLVVPHAIPDHSIIEWVTDVPAFADSGDTQATGGEHLRRFNVKDIPGDFLQDGNSEAVLAAMQRIEDSSSTQSDINSAYDEFVSLVTKSLDVFCTTNSKSHNATKRHKRTGKPYWNQELQLQWNEVCQLERQWRRANNQGQKRKLRRQYCNQRTQFDKLHRKFKRSYQLKEQSVLLEQLQHCNSSVFWKSFGKIGIGNDRKVRIPMEVANDDGTIVTDPELVMKRWRDDYEVLYNDNANTMSFDDTHLSFVRNSLTTDDVTAAFDDVIAINRGITRDEVKAAIFRCKLRKAAGIDSIPAEAIKNDICIDILHRLMEYCFESGCVPESWKSGIINPIVKPGTTDVRQPLTYRGICLISVSCKVYCDILNHRLSAFIEDHHSLAEEQNGFRKQRSCMDHIYSLYEILNNRRCSDQSTFACFIDMKKAFDNVNRDCLWYKLKKSGIGGPMLKAIQSLYEGVNCAVRVNDSLTPWFKVPKGVKQGCLLSPILFAIYIDDLALSIKNLNCGIDVKDANISILLYADDIVLLAPTEEYLQMMLDKVHEWCFKWRLELNGEKSQIVHFRPGKRECSKVIFKCGDLTLKYTQSYKYLGLWFDEHLDFKTAVNQLAKSAGRALSALFTKFCDAGGMAYEVFTALYDSLIQPILTYGAGIWGLYEHKCLNTIQNRACRFFLGATCKTSNIATRGDMGWTSCVTKQRLEVFKLWRRVGLMHESRLPNKIHKWSLNRKRSWEHRVQKLSKALGLEQYLYAVNVKSTVQLIRKQLNILDEQKWFTDLWDDKGNLPNGNKLRTYRMFKKDLCPEAYVTNAMSRHHRKSFIRLRACSLPLRIETGRYSKPPTPLHDRICPLCPLEIEDEAHFAITCPLYSDIMYDVLKYALIADDKFMHKNPTEKYVFLMQNPYCQLFLASKIHLMARRRDVLL